MTHHSPIQDRGLSEKQATCPTRDFLVRQSILNALTVDMGHIPITPAKELLPLRWKWFDTPPNDTERYCNLVRIIRSEFRRLASRYSAPSEQKEEGILYQGMSK